MPRDYKGFVKYGIYHVYNRGNNKQNVFLDNQDYANLIKRLKILLGLSDYTPPKRHGKDGLRLTPFSRGDFEIIAYCLMPNHFHFVIKQNSDTPVGSLIQRLYTSYTKYFNKKYSRIGRLFQDIFKTRYVGHDAYLSYLTAYIHNNPNHLGFKYSSYNEYVTKNTTENICNTKIVLDLFNNNKTLYKKFIIESRSAAKAVIEVEKF